MAGSVKKSAKPCTSPLIGGDGVVVVLPLRFAQFEQRKRVVGPERAFCRVDGDQLSYLDCAGSSR